MTPFKKGETVGLLVFWSRKLLILWLFKQSEISILFTLMIFVIRYFARTVGTTFIQLKVCVLRD